MSAVRFEQAAHLGSTGCVSACQRVFVVRGGVEPPTFRFSEGLMCLEPSESENCVSPVCPHNS
jgi:hypothetical protein